MDVVLFHPAPRSGWQAHRRVEVPLSLLCPATPLDRAGYRVAIVDQFADPHWKRKLGDALGEKPICFGVTCMTGPQILHALEGCRLVRQRHPDVPIVWGGVHPSLLPEQTLENANVDIVVVGEGEATLLELVAALAAGRPLSGVAGIAYRENGRYRFTGARPFVDLDEQPPPAYHLIDLDRYRRRIFGRDHISVNSSRGCAHHCRFCYDGVIQKRKWRAMQPDTVVEHLRRVVRDYDIRGFNFTDDNFFLDMDRAHDIMEKVVRADLDIRFGKLHVRADAILRMDDDFLRLLARAGVERLTIGVESGSQRVLDFIRKGVTVEQVLEASRKLIPYHIVPVYLFMMGFPSETPDELAESVRLAMRLTGENPRASKSLNIYTPYPGTELYEVAVQHGLRRCRRLEEWAPLNYRYVPDDAPWMLTETRKLVEGLDFPLMFLGKGHFVKPYKKTNPLVVALARLYYPLARYRVKHMDVRFPIETRIVKFLGLFGRQA